MAEAAHLVLVPLVVISGLCAFILAVAWRAFGHVEHALTWACGFLLLALMWAMQWLVPAVQANPPAEALTSAIVGGAAVVLATVGFRQRAQLPLWAGRLSAFWLVQVAASLALARVASPIVLLTAPAHIQGLVMLVISSRTLRGRRRSERLAERGAEVALLIAAIWLGIRIGDATGLAGRALEPLRELVGIAQPTVVMAVGLFAISLIAADLADRMRRLASTDRLTGLLNRRGLDEALRAIIGSARRNGRSIVLVVTDIDHFKAVNDAHGHAVGDEAIRAFGDCLTANVARRDLVARIGGEEFAVVMTDVDAQTALCATEVLRECVEELRVGPGRERSITASFGLVPLRLDITLTELLARADAALYQSKARGRNRATLVE